MSDNSHIRLIDDAGRSAIGRYSAVVLSSAAAPWEGIVLEQHRYRTGEVSGVRFDQHVIGVKIGAPMRLESHSHGCSKRRIVVAGDVCIHPRGAPVHGRREDEGDIVHVALEPDFVRRADGESTRALHLEHIAGHILADPLIARVALALKVELETGCTGGALYGESLGLALAARLLDRPGGAEGCPQRKGGLSRPALQRVLDYLHDHLGSGLTVAAMAEICHLSPYHFSRAFKQSTAMTPHQYVLRARIEAAQGLLEHDDASLAEIAFRVGFADQSHLARHFRRARGVTPARFRRMTRAWRTQEPHERS